MSRPTDQQLDESVAAMLRFGVSLAAVVVILGAVLLLRHPATAAPDYRHFQAGDAALRTLPGIVRGAMRLQPRSVIQFGLLILIATPVARVALCVLGFARQKSGLYVGISLMVLGVLLFSLLKATL